MLVSQSKNTPKQKQMICLLEIDRDFVPKKVHNFSENKYGQNLGHILVKNSFAFALGCFLTEKQASTFVHFLYISEPYWTP